MWSSRVLGAVATSVVCAAGALAQAQPPPQVLVPVPARQITFQAAIAQAIEANPTVKTAVAVILRAEGMLRQARAATLLQVTANATTTTLNTDVEFQGVTVTPQNSLAASVTADMPIVAAAAWARHAQAKDTVEVAQLNAADVRRQVAFATADAYLTILGTRRVVEANIVARDVAKAHYDLAAELERRGTGSRLNALRAQGQWSADEAIVETAQLSLYRAQEALGVLIASNEPVDAADEPEFAVPPADEGSLALFRTDLKLFAAEQHAAEHVLRDSSKDWWPTLDAVFQPSTTVPAPFFLPAYSWRLLMQGNAPIFDSGQRASLKMQRQASVDQARETLAGASLQAASEVRAAREAVASTERSLASLRAAASQAEQVVMITSISFRAGAATNIEVIDAQRSARDAATAAAVSEDNVRRARLELLNALGRFP